MRLAQGHAGWALLAAGTVGLAVSAAAQVSPSPAPAAAAARPAETPPAAARLAEIRVELAWLTDPGTFPYELAARVSGGKLEVGGVVPTEALRQRAVQVARLECKLPVVDKLLVVPSAAVVPVRDGDGSLARTAANAVTKNFAHFAGNFQVSADAAGHVTVTGEVPSCEDKLTISRRLAQVTGCTAVVNSLTVAALKHEGKVCTPVSADRKQLVAGEPKDLIPNLAPEVLASAVAKAAAPAPAVVAKTPAPAPAVAKTSTPATTPVVAKPAAPPAVATPAPKPASSPVVAAPAPKPAAPAALAPSVVAAPRVVQAPAVAAATPANNNGILRTSATEVVPAPKPAAAAPTAARPAAPAERAAPAKPAGAPALTPQALAQVKQGIEKVGKGKIHDLAMKVQPGNELELRFTVKSEADGQALGRQVMNLPELAPYKVDLKVDVK